MTLEEIKCFCEEKGAAVRVESPLGTITYSPEDQCDLFRCPPI